MEKDVAVIHMCQVKRWVLCMTGWEVMVIAFLSIAVMGDQTLCVLSLEEMIVLGSGESIYLKYMFV